MIIWQGFGFLVPVALVGSMVATQLLVNALSQNPVYYQTHSWPKLAGFWLTAAVTYVLASYFDSRPGKTVIEKDTGREIVQKSTSSLFFVPMRYWAFVFLALGVYYYFKK